MNRSHGRWLYIALIPAIALLSSGGATEEPPAWKVGFDAGSGFFHLESDSPNAMKKLVEADLTAERWSRIFGIFTHPPAPHGNGKLPAMLGTYRIQGTRLYFEPRFPLEKGLTYFVRFEPAALHLAVPSLVMGQNSAPVSASFTLDAKSRPESRARVLAVYPSGPKIPENLLKFYIHFSEPMTAGGVYRHIQLQDENGKRLPAAYLKIEPELWDASKRRLTLLLDPGRIKRGLKPHEEMGPPLKEGQTVSLAIDAAWEDARGAPLSASFRKTYRVTASDRTSPDLSNWRLEAPPVESKQPLKLLFPESMDHGMLHRVLQVHDHSGKVVEGEIRVEKRETCWLFWPSEPWREGEHEIRVAVILEDTAGNSLARAFDRKTSADPNRKTEAFRTLSFQPKKPPEGPP